MPAAFAADESFVGVLALATQRDVSERLGLDDQARQQLGELINRRENEALEIVLELKDLPPAEQIARLAPFVEESERQGLALLSVAQREKLQQLHLSREGMSVLSEPRMAATLDLSDEQQAEVRKLLEQRNADMTIGGERERRITRGLYERRLAGVLTDGQRTAWQKLAGLSDAPTVAVAQVEADADLPPAGTGEPSSSDSSESKQPAPTEPTPTEPAPTEPTPTEPTPTEPAPTEPAPTEPAPTEPPSTDSSEPAEDAPRTATPPGEMPEDRPTEAAPAPEAEPAIADDGKLYFNFTAAPWQDVLDWFAESAGLSLALEIPPVGTFTYTDDRGYTPDEALDLLNSYLLTKGYSLVRRQRLLLVLDLENPVPEELVTLVTLDELDERGRYELVKCLFPLARMSAEDAALMIDPYLGPQGLVIPFEKARQVLVTETAGKLRTIRDMIARVEDPAEGALESVIELKLKDVSAEEVMAIARPLLGLAEGENSGEGISIAIDLLGTRMFATGEVDKLQLLRELVPRLDTPPSGDGSEIEEPEELQLKTYYVRSADPQVVLRVAQTLLANLPGVRLEIDATSGKLVALARPSEHKTIDETIQQLEGQGRQFEVITLKRLDPQLAVLAVNKFFGLDVEGDEEVPADSPIVDGDPLSMQLWVRGTVQQIEQIRELVAKLEGPEDEASELSRVRMIPLTGPEVQSALDTIEQFWTRGNRIRIVTPSALTPSSIRQRTINPDDEDSQSEEQGGRPAEQPLRFPTSGDAPVPAAGVNQSAVNQTKSNRRPTGTVMQFASQLQDQTTEPAESTPGTSIGAKADIRVAITPGGLLIASDDPEALDAFEDLIRTITGPGALVPQREITVFYLKHAKAEVAQQLLESILGGSSSSDLGGSLLGDMASSLVGGGLMGSLLGGMAGGGGSESSTTTIQASGLVSIVPDPRLNALVVEANQADVTLIEDLLKIIDREGSITEVQTAGVPRVIPVVYSSAEDVATVVRQVFAAQISSGQSGQQRQPSPEDFIRALRGGRGGQNDQQSRGEPEKMTVGVDARNNALIVSASEGLFRQVEYLVEQIDQPGSADSDIVSIVPLKVSDPEVVKSTLGSILGTTTTRSSSSPSSGGSSPAPGGDATSEQIQQRIEFFRRLRESGGFGGGGPGGGPPSGFGGRPGGGGGPSGSRGGSRGGGRGR